MVLPFIMWPKLVGGDLPVKTADPLGEDSSTILQARIKKSRKDLQGKFFHNHKVKSRNCIISKVK